MTHVQQMIVMEAAAGVHKKLWAWCQVGDGPGFEQIDYTMADGVTPIVNLEGPPVLGRWLFTVPLRAAVDIYPVTVLVSDLPNAPERVKELGRQLVDGIRSGLSRKDD